MLAVPSTPHPSRPRASTGSSRTELVREVAHNGGAGVRPQRSPELSCSPVDRARTPPRRTRKHLAAQVAGLFDLALLHVGTSEVESNQRRIHVVGCRPV